MSNHMNIIIKKYSYLLLLVVVLSACSKQNGFGPNYSAYNGGDVPVSVQNTVGNRPDATVTASIGGGSSHTTTEVITFARMPCLEERNDDVACFTYYAFMNKANTACPQAATLP